MRPDPIEELRLRERLRSAVRAQPVPAELPALVRERIRRESSSWFAWNWGRYGAAAAAMALIAAAIWVGPGDTPIPEVANRRAQAIYITKVAAAVGAIFRPGLNDHIHCAIFRRYPANPPSLAEMEAELGEYKGLLPLVKPAVPDGYRVVMAHRCSYGGRHYVHLVMRDGNRVISLVITRKEDGETMAAGVPAMRAAGVPVYRASAEGYRVAGFESEHYLAFVVSGLGDGENLQIAAMLASGVRQLLG